MLLITMTASGSYFSGLVAALAQLVLSAVALLGRASCQIQVHPDQMQVELARV